MSGAYAWSLLFTCSSSPSCSFSMIVAGRDHLAPAIWVYGDMVLLALTAIGITLVIERDIQRRLVPSGRPEYGVLDRFGYSLILVYRFYRPDGAMYAYFLNLASPLVRRWTERV